MTPGDPVGRERGGAGSAFDDRATPTAGLLGVLAALSVPVVLAAGGAGTAIGLAAAGAGLHAAGVVLSRASLVRLGGIGALLAALAAGGTGSSPPATLAAAVGALVAWEAGTYAIATGQQVGRGGANPETEARHVARTAAVGVAVAGAVVGLFRLVGAGQPAPVLAAMALAVLALAFALRD